MVEWAKFKPEVSGSLLVLVVCLMLAIVSISFPYWLTNGRLEVEGADVPLTTVSFGLFEGRKTRTRGGTCTRTVKWVCRSGVCMLSCGETAAARRSDIDFVIQNSNISAPAGDNQLCSPCKNSPPLTQTAVGSHRDSEQSDPTKTMVRQSILVTVIILLLVGLLFTFISIVMTVLNIVHTPVSSILGIDGLIVWNLTAGLMYLLVMMIWGAEYNMKLSSNLGISDSLRPGPSPQLTSHSTIGWCCLLLICPMFLHLGLSGLFVWRQYKRYYNKQTKQNREMRINVQDPSQGGTDILF